MKVSNAELYAMLVRRGYEVVVIQDGDTQRAQFQGKYSKPYMVTHSYSMDWSDGEIKSDLAQKLMQWARLRLEMTLV